MVHPETVTQETLIASAPPAPKPLTGEDSPVTSRVRGSGLGHGERSPSLLSSLRSDLRVVRQLLFHRSGNAASHAERLERFYAPQASSYDAFRERLLKGRSELMQELVARLKSDPVIIDCGGGTGRNAELFEAAGGRWSELHIVDLAPSVLKVAEGRVRTHSWRGVSLHQADVTTFSLPAESRPDLIMFSYSLTMIPDWYAALNQMATLLKPGGIMAVVDFFVPPKFPSYGEPSRGALSRAFWPLWFGFDNVFPSPDHIPVLMHYLEKESLIFDSHRLPYLPLIRVPIYRFVGRKVP